MPKTTRKCNDQNQTNFSKQGYEIYLKTTMDIEHVPPQSPPNPPPQSATQVLT